METFRYLFSSMTKFEALTAAVLFVLFVVSVWRLLKDFSGKSRNKKRFSRGKSGIKPTSNSPRGKVYA